MVAKTEFLIFHWFQYIKSTNLQWKHNANQANHQNSLRLQCHFHGFSYRTNGKPLISFVRNSVDITAAICWYPKLNRYYFLYLVISAFDFWIYLMFSWKNSLRSKIQSILLPESADIRIRFVNIFNVQLKMRKAINFQGRRCKRRRRLRSAAPSLQAGSCACERLFSITPCRYLACL